MTKVILTRHGHVEGISPERFRGRTDVPLTELGTTQAESLAARISAEWRPRAVYTSPMTRCVATGARIAKRCGIAAQVLEDLNEISSMASGPGGLPRRLLPLGRICWTSGTPCHS